MKIKAGDRVVDRGGSLWVVFWVGRTKRGNARYGVRSVRTGATLFGFADQYTGPVTDRHEADYRRYEAALAQRGLVPGCRSFWEIVTGRPVEDMLR